MSLRPQAAHAALVVLLVATLLTSGAAGADAGPIQQTGPESTLSSDETVIFVQFRADGNARWEVATHFSLTSEADRTAFAEIADRFERGEYDTQTLRAFREAAAAANESTDRRMEITGENRTADVDNGTLTVSLTWTNFARQEGDDYHVGDAFNTSDGPWLSLAEDQTLVMAVPEGYGIRSAPKRSRDGRITWEGPREFETADLSLTYIGNGGVGSATRRSPSTSTTADTGGTPTTDGTGPGTDGRTGGGPGERDPVLWGGFLVLGLGIVVVGVYVLSRRDGATSAGKPIDDVPDADPPDDEDEPEEEPDEVAEELLSDEERVERLLERNGGRMKQANIVTETGWSNAKVSQLLSSMEEEGRIDKLRIGRENLISFPDEDVTDFED